MYSTTIHRPRAEARAQLVRCVRFERTCLFQERTFSFQTACAEIRAQKNLLDRFDLPGITSFELFSMGGRPPPVISKGAIDFPRNNNPS